MAILNDGNVDSITNLTSTGEDSKGQKLNFKEDKDGGGFTADGTDGKRYTITFSQGKVSVFDIPATKAAPAAAAPTNTKK